MSGPTLAPSKPRRRRFVLSLRALMLLVLVVGGWLGWRARRASIQRRSVAAIKEVGGTILYDFMFQGPKIVPGASPWAPSWLRGPIGDKYFQEPKTVFLEPSNLPGERQPTDATLEAVAALDHVEDLNSYHVPISDVGFARLAAMPRLKSFCLLDVDVTEAGLASVESFPALETLRLRVRPPGGLSARALEFVARQPRLKWLELMRLNLPDPASLAPLARLTRLEYLRLEKSPEDDVCLESLRDLTRMKILDLRETKLTDAGLERLDGMDQLETLLVDGSKFTEAGLARLVKHGNLSTLWINPCPNITDAGLEILGRLRSLEDLCLPGSNVTDAGLAHLEMLKIGRLSLSGPGVTDAGLAKLAASNKFYGLDLSGTSVTGAGLPVLAGQVGLESLVLDRTKVDDAGMASLVSLPALDTLGLAETLITDAGLLAIVQKAPRLRSLDVRGTKVTPQGVATVRRLKPALKIESSAGP